MHIYKIWSKKGQVLQKENNSTYQFGTQSPLEGLLFWIHSLCPEFPLMDSYLELLFLEITCSCLVTFSLDFLNILNLVLFKCHLLWPFSKKFCLSWYIQDLETTTLDTLYFQAKHYKGMRTVWISVLTRQGSRSISAYFSCYHSNSPDTFWSDLVCIFCTRVFILLCLDIVQ